MVTKECPICGAEIDSRGYKRHFKSKPCFLDADGIQIGCCRLVGKRKHPETECRFCAEIIKEYEPAILTCVNFSSYGSVNSLGHIHTHHVKDELIAARNPDSRTETV